MAEIKPIHPVDEKQIHSNLIKMSHLVQQATERSADCLKLLDKVLAGQIIDGDSHINEFRNIIEQECISVLATRRLPESALRDLIAAIHIADELERIADHAADIAKIVLQMRGDHLPGPMGQLSRMSETCVAMLLRVTESLDNRDEDLARAAADSDAEVDALERAIVNRLVNTVGSAPDYGHRATHLMWIAHHFERIGDRVTNIAERVVFMATGETPSLGQSAR